MEMLTTKLGIGIQNGGPRIQITGRPIRKRSAFGPLSGRTRNNITATGHGFSSTTRVISFCYYWAVRTFTGRFTVETIRLILLRGGNFIGFYIFFFFVRSFKTVNQFEQYNVVAYTRGDSCYSIVISIRNVRFVKTIMQLPHVSP